MSDQQPEIINPIIYIHYIWEIKHQSSIHKNSSKRKGLPFLRVPKKAIHHKAHGNNMYKSVSVVE